MKKRRTVKNLTIDQNVRCARVIPVVGSKKQITDLATVGVTLTKEQAIHLARVLLVATQEWDTVDITAFRMQRRSDGTYPLTVTSTNYRNS